MMMRMRWRETEMEIGCPLADDGLRSDVKRSKGSRRSTEDLMHVGSTTIKSEARSWLNKES